MRSRHSIGPRITIGPLTVECSYWPLAQARWLWWPRSEPLVVAPGRVVTWLCLDWTVTR